MMKRFNNMLFPIIACTLMCSCSSPFSSVRSNYASINAEQKLIANGCVYDADAFGDYFISTCSRNDFTAEYSGDINDFIRDGIKNYLENNIVSADQKLTFDLTDRVLIVENNRVFSDDGYILFEFSYSEDFCFYQQTSNSYVLDNNNNKTLYSTRNSLPEVNYAWYFADYKDNYLRAIRLYVNTDDLNSSIILPFSIYDYSLSKRLNLDNYKGNFVCSLADHSQGVFTNNFNDYLTYFEESKLIDLSSCNRISIENSIIKLFNNDILIDNFIFDSSLNSIINEENSFRAVLSRNSNNANISNFHIQIDLNLPDYTIVNSSHRLTNIFYFIISIN